MSKSAEHVQAEWDVAAIKDGLNGSRVIEQIRQGIENLNNTLDSVRLCLEAIEQNTRISNREWRVMEVETQDLIPRCEELFNQQWKLDQVLTANKDTKRFMRNAQDTSAPLYPKNLILIFWRPLSQTKPEGGKTNG